MSVYVRLNNKSRKGDRIKFLLDYVNDECKTEENLCHTVNMSKTHARQDMILLKALYRQTEGRQVIHSVLSMDEGVSPEMTDLVAQEVLKLLARDYQVYAVTHTNTLHNHTHFVINSVNIRTGNKFNESRTDMLKFREQIDDILLKYGLATISPSFEEMDIEDWDTTYENHNASNILSRTDNKENVLYDEEDMIIGLSDSKQEKYNVSFYEQQDYWTGTGAVEGKCTYTPGVYYATQPLIKGVIYDEPETEKDKNSIDNPDVNKNVIPFCYMVNGEMFEGNLTYEDGKILIPGIFYDNIDE